MYIYIYIFIRLVPAPTLSPSGMIFNSFPVTITLTQPQNAEKVCYSSIDANDCSTNCKSSVTLFVYAALNVCFDRNRGLPFTGKSQKSSFCP